MSDSRQRAWRQRKLADGLCVRCGQEPVIAGFTIGRTCQQKLRARADRLSKRAVVDLWTARTVLGALGYTEVETAAGWRPLEDWHPFGGSPQWRGRILQGGVVEDVRLPDGFSDDDIGTWACR